MLHGFIIIPFGKFAVNKITDAKTQTVRMLKRTYFIEIQIHGAVYYNFSS